MINTLRKKFILATMISVIIVFTVILGIINIVNYSRVAKDTDNIIQFLATNNGQFNGVPSDKGEMPPIDDKMDGNPDYEKALENFKIDKETPYATRYFTVSYDENGNVTTSNTMHIAAVTSDAANEMATKVLSSNKTSGYINNYRYKVIEDKNMVIFVDSSTQLGTAKNFLWISIIVALTGIVGVFILVVLISSRVVKPLAESYEKQKQFITDASHELKTPLTIISANNELIEMEHGENESTKVISKQVTRLTSMVKNLTALARLDEAASAEMVEMDLSNIVEDMVEVFRPAVEADGRKFALRLQECVKCVGDEKLIRQLISVLFENAAKYAKTETVVDFSRQGQRAVLLVKNDAEGLTQGDMDKCFERFYRAASTRASGKEGSGIGLSIAKEIVNLHKGTIEAFVDNENYFNIKVVL